MARYVETVINKMYRVNGSHPYNIVCIWDNPVDHKEYIFKSQNLWLDPVELIREKNIDTFPVYIDRKNIIYSGCYFVAGGLIYLYKDPFVSLKNRFRWVVLLLIAVFAFLYFNFSSSTIVMLPLYSFMLIYAVVCGYNCRRYILDNPVTKFLSGISMEIYLSHMVIYRLLEKMNIIHLITYTKIHF